MKRVLSGLQPTGQLHLGNYAGAIRQFIDMQDEYEMFIFVASYHALSSIHDADELRQNVRQVVIDYLAFGLDPTKSTIYLQQDVPQVTELSWMLSCACPKHLMDKGASYKDKIAQGLAPSVGLYTYPILQAADIVAVNADLVPVGKDQKQHLEITRDLVQKFNHRYGEVFKMPEIKLRPDAEILPGIDGRKMSKSYNNTIDPFMDEKPLRKRIMKIVTDSTPQEDAKDPEACPIFQMFRAIAGRDDERTIDLAKKYQSGGYGYGHAKQELFELILDHFGEARTRRIDLQNDSAYIDKVLRDGAAAAQVEVSKVTAAARVAVGLE